MRQSHIRIIDENTPKSYLLGFRLGKLFLALSIITLVVIGVMAVFVGLGTNKINTTDIDNVSGSLKTFLIFLKDISQKETAGTAFFFLSLIEIVSMSLWVFFNFFIRKLDLKVNAKQNEVWCAKLKKYEYKCLKSAAKKQRHRQNKATKKEMKANYKASKI